MKEISLERYIENAPWHAVAYLKANPRQFSMDTYALMVVEEEKSARPFIQKLRQYFVDKGFDFSAGRQLAQQGMLGSLFNELVLRNQDSALNISISKWFAHALSPKANPTAVSPQYTGTPEENAEVDRAIADSVDKSSDRRKFAGRGATRVFKLAETDRTFFKDFLRGVPVVVLGAGPAGLMATREMIEMGFDPDDITVLDRTGNYGGIWNQKNVNQGSKNNPFQFNFEDITLDPAPGSGETVTDFLRAIEDPQRTKFRKNLPKPIKANVIGVYPGDLNHGILYRTEDGIKAIRTPIVINALGNGKPLHPSREGHMTTDTPHEAGIRWQQVLTDGQAERYRGKTLVFIGLGNSTAEMLVQLRDLNERGYNIDYRVVTHYPLEAVQSPEQEVEENGRKFKVFRDIKAPNLVKWEADLPDAREVYNKALNDGKIISDATSWHAEDGKLTVTRGSGMSETIACDQQFTLIGYGQDPEFLRDMHMTVTDEYLGNIAYDYDGEIQREPGAKGRERLYPGYFGLGAILKSPENPNAVVMPGIMHRMNDMLFSVAVRATEYRAPVGGYR